MMELITQATATGLLVATYSYGKLLDPIDHFPRDYELMEYCEGDTLAQIDLKGNEKRLGEIALQSAIEIDFLHKKGIIHRDVKLANFFFRTPQQRMEDLTLGDFGIAVLADKDGKAQIDYQPRTFIYTAPEYYYSVDGKIQISYKSDCDSLGMMLLVLWNGADIYRINEYQSIDMKRMGTLPYPTNVSDHMLQLMKALTDVNPATRAGLPEIIKWRKGESIFHLKKP